MSRSCIQLRRELLQAGDPCVEQDALDAVFVKSLQWNLPPSDYAEFIAWL